jgi:hypothetical protein
MLDTEWTMATANSFGSYLDTAHVYVYMAGSWSQATNSDVFNTMLTNGYARVFTTSWSCTEDTGCSSTAINAWHGIFDSMLAQGWTLMTASGDRGATDDCYFNNPAHTSVAYPASDPDVLAVGGTSLSLNSDGTWAGETGWQGGTSTGSCAGNNGGSGGGQSVHFARPSYQDYYSGATGRLVPDVSLNSGGIGQNFYFNGTLSPTGGTSIASPEMAGFFAQENAYLLAVGNICGASYNAPCGPYGQPQAALFDEGLYNRSMHYPFYDITTGCNSNDQTSAHSLTYYCAHSSYDLVTGWGPSNMMQLAWSLNWERLSGAANGAPYLTWTGPAINSWHNTSQTVSWTVNDYAGNEGPNGTGIAGFWQAWDTPPSDSASEAHGGSGDLFYSGPQYPNAVNGCLSFVYGANGCAGGVSQGCHTAYAVGWNNEGWTTAYGGQSYSYGPICYDTVPPVTTTTLSGTVRGTVFASPVTVTLSASDPAPGSGVALSNYQVDSGALLTYSVPFVVGTTGNHTVYFYSTDVAGNVETTKSVNFWVKSPTTTVVTSTVNPSAFHRSVSFKATVTPAFGATPLGSVAFKNNGVVVATVALSGGVATWTTNVLTVGSHTIIGVYGTSGKDIASVSAPITQTVNQAATTTTVTSSLNPSSWHQAVTFTATVHGAFGGVPTGTVTFKNASGTLGTGILNASGVATLTTTALSVAVHSIAVTYAGDTDFVACSSSPLAQTVNKAATTTTLVSSLNPSTHGTAVTFTATITPAFGGAVTGTVNFKDGSTVIGTGTVNAARKATFTTSALTVGTHAITAVYTASTNLKSSFSTAVHQVVK